MLPPPLPKEMKAHLTWLSFPVRVAFRDYRVPSHNHRKGGGTGLLYLVQMSQSKDSCLIVSHLDWCSRTWDFFHCQRAGTTKVIIGLCNICPVNWGPFSCICKEQIYNTYMSMLTVVTDHPRNDSADKQVGNVQWNTIYPQQGWQFWHWL